MNTQVLRELGLTDGEVKVYLALVGLGESTSGPIVEESGVSVSKVYVLLDRLAKKGLVSHVIKEKTKHFRAADPERLRSYLREKQEKLSESERELDALVRALAAKQGSTLTAETAQVYDGLRGIQAARERSLPAMKKGDEMWILGIARTPYDRLAGYFAEFHKRRVAKGVRCRYLYDEYAREPFGKRSAALALSEVRYLPPGVITHAWMEVYADTVTIGINKGKAFSVVIQNQEVAASFKEYAKLLWEMGKR